MLEAIIKYFTVFLGSMFKFIAGPTAGIATGLTVFETTFFTVLGMMTSVLLFSSAGNQLKKIIPSLFKRKRLFTAANRRIVVLWRRFGLKGIAFLTPLLLSPIIGTMVAVSFGESKKRIFTFMLVSAIFWGCTFSLAIYALSFLGSR